MLHIQEEIAEQPAVMERLLRDGMPVAEKIASAVRAFDPAFVLIAARGTSDNAARYAQYIMGVYAGLSVALATPSIHTLYEHAPRLSKALVIGVSQSGQSEDVRRVLRDGRDQGALTVALTNAPESPLAHEAQFHLPLMAGPEISVAATKSYTAELMGLAMLVAALTDNAELRSTLTKAPMFAQETLDRASDIEGWAQRYRYMDKFATIGRGYNYCTAFEISLKIKELCYITGVEYSEADFLHGPIALVQAGFPVLTIAPAGKTLSRLVNLLAQLKERKAERLVITNSTEAEALGHKVMRIPSGIPEWITPLFTVIPGQTLAMHLALAMGHTVDAPTGLHKVTVTE